MVVPVGNWYSRLPINAATGFVEWPFGPLKTGPREKMVRVEVWLMQESTGAIQMTYQYEFPNPHSPSPKFWYADIPWYPKKSKWKKGRFKEGAALGTAVAIAEKEKRQIIYWWTQEVNLYCPEEPRGTQKLRR
jgi:hypothetical protein